MGCSSSLQMNGKGVTYTTTTSFSDSSSVKKKPFKAEKFLHSSIVIQKFFRRYKARLEIRRRCAWRIFQEIEYSAEQDQINLYNFFNEIVSNIDNNNNNQGYAQSFSELLKKNSSPKDDDVELSVAKAIEEIDTTIVEDFYAGPRVQLPLTLAVVHELLEFFKTGQTLHAKYVKCILHEATMKVKQLPNVQSTNLNISKQITVVGDLHGKLDDLFTIFHKNGLPSADNPYIFNGDFVDRGKCSIEIVVLLCCFFLLYPAQVFINRGNHEDYIMNARYGFTKELTDKYKTNAKKVKTFCREFFAWLPLATIVGNKIFVTHGGVSDKTDLEQLMNVRRDKFVSILKPSHVKLDEANPPTMEEIQEWEQVLDVLWSDPRAQNGKSFNQQRGGGCCFGPDVTKKVLEKHQWDLIIRSHECKFEGYEYMHNNKVLTIFSASSYYTESSNLGAYVKLDVNLTPRIVQFTVSKDSRLNKRVGMNEESAMKELREKIYSHKDELVQQFKKLDYNNTGKLSVNDWSSSLEEVLQLKLPWSLLRDKLVESDSKGAVKYMTCVEGFKVNSTLPQSDLISETIYRNKQVLETVFRIIDKDCSGFISSDEFEEACRVLNQYTNGMIPDNRIKELAKTLDINKDGAIDFNEFLEAFRLVSADVRK